MHRADRARTCCQRDVAAGALQRHVVEPYLGLSEDEDAPSCTLVRRDLRGHRGTAGAAQAVSAARSRVPVRLVGAAGSDGRSGSASSRGPVAPPAL